MRDSERRKSSPAGSDCCQMIEEFANTLLILMSMKQNVLVTISFTSSYFAIAISIDVHLTRG